MAELKSKTGMELEDANTLMCQELTLLKLELLQDHDINYKPRI